MASSGIIPILAPGYAAIYGTASIYGFTGQSAGITFGRLYQLSGAPSNNYSLGQNVLFPYKDVHSVSYAGVTYYIIPESQIILVERESPLT